MFHTWFVPKDYKDAPLTYKVVIPWRGFRCFTLIVASFFFDRKGVVIPWRGFRCFTRRYDRDWGVGVLRHWL